MSDEENAELAVLLCDHTPAEIGKELLRLRAALKAIANARNPADDGVWIAYCEVRDFARDILDGKDVDL
jgi:hypothetical protein